MHDCRNTAREAMKRFYIQQYEDVFYVILYGLAGGIHMQQLNRWLNNNQTHYNRVFRSMVNIWADLDLVYKIKISRNYIIYPRNAVYRYFGLYYNHLPTSNRLKQTSLLMEKYLVDEQCYQYPPDWLRKRIQKTNTINFLPNGQAHLNVIHNYMRALKPYHWDLTGLEYEAKAMEEHIKHSFSQTHCKSVNKHIISKNNMYRYACKYIYLTGAKIEPYDNTINFKIYVDILYTTYIENDLLIRRIIDAYDFFSELLYDLKDKKHQVKVVITILSHQKEDRVFEKKILSKLKQTSEFCLMDDEYFESIIRFHFFNSESKLFSGFPVKDII